MEAAVETFKSIQEWAWSTFGRADTFRSFQRAGEEWDELSDEFYDWHGRDVPLFCRKGLDQDRIATEAADVIITLLNIAGVPEAIQAKMETNRAREWRMMGDGTGYHIKKDTPE